MNILDRPELQAAARAFAQACEASRAHEREAHAALRRFGDHGANISGCVRDHFPPNVKERLHRLAHSVTAYSNEAYSLRPPRVRLSTMRKLARAVAARDGTGYYGPQA